MVRLYLGAALMGAMAIPGVTHKWRVLRGVIGTVALLTGWTGYCPANAALGIDTCKFNK